LWHLITFHEALKIKYNSLLIYYKTIKIEARLFYFKSIYFGADFFNVNTRIISDPTSALKTPFRCRLRYGGSFKPSKFFPDLNSEIKI